MGTYHIWVSIVFHLRGLPKKQFQNMRTMEDKSKKQAEFGRSPLVSWLNNIFISNQWDSNKRYHLFPIARQKSKAFSDWKQAGSTSPIINTTCKRVWESPRWPSEIASTNIIPSSTLISCIHLWLCCQCSFFHAGSLFRRAGFPPPISKCL